MKEKELKMNWFYFHTYVRLPFGAITAFGTLATEFEKAGHDLYIKLLFGLDVALVAVLVMTSIFLHRREARGYSFNLFVLVAGVITPLLTGEYALAAASLIFNVPTYFYFRKRKHLFTAPQILR